MDPSAAAASAAPAPLAEEGAAHPHLSEHEPLATELLPKTNATLTIRVIKSFEFRTQKSLVLRGVDLERETVGGLMRRCQAAVSTTPGFKPYRSLVLDTFKLYTQAHGHKTQNLIINLDNDDWILSDPEATLASIGAENETEISLFNREAYEHFKLNPEVNELVYHVASRGGRAHGRSSGIDIHSRATCYVYTPHAPP